MKEVYVKTWKKSVQPRRQRKYQYNAPLHIVGKGLRVSLSKELRKKEGTRNIRLRKGDKVKVLRGQHKGKAGKVEKISLKYSNIYISGIEQIRKDGTKSLISLVPSNLQVIELDKSDKKRFKVDKNGKKAPKVASSS